MMPKRAGRLVLAALLAGTFAYAQGVRDHTRPTDSTGTTVSKSQAIELTLTLSAAATRPLQTWVRTAGTIDETGKVLTAYVDPPSAGLMKVGQWVRAFPLESRSSMYQARVSRVVKEADRVRVEATMPGTGRENSGYYLMEIAVERGQWLSVPNEAIIEEEDRRVVYVQQHPGDYVPREIHTGLQAELYTQVLHGLAEGEQVVTFGSFFIDAEHKLKTTEQSPMSDAQHHR